MQPIAIARASAWLALTSTALLACTHGGAAAPGVRSTAPAVGAPVHTAQPYDPCAFAHARRVDVRDADELAYRLAHAAAGELIVLAEGRYRGPFVAAASGRAQAPIILCGSRAAVLEGADLSSGNVLELRANHWVLSGFSVTHGQRGIVLHGASHNVLRDLFVHDLGQEGVHLRAHSCHNVIEHCRIDATGLREPGFGEGIYVGTAQRDWALWTGAADAPDRSDHNRILRNVIGPQTASENIDIKEGTSFGEIRENRFLGRGLRGENYGDSWVDLKGNAYVVADNHGTDAPGDGFQVHVIVDGFGHDHVFSGNLAEVNGSGLGFRIDKRAQGVRVRCDNRVSGAAEGFANVACDP